MSLEKVEIPVPRLRKWMGGITLVTTLAVIIILSGHILAEHIYLLRWMRNHDQRYSGRFEIWHGSETPKTAWLPVLLYRSPHHQLAIAASITNIVVSALIMVIFIISAWGRKNFGQHWFLILLFVPTLVLNTIALLYNFI
ncbi:hypothetical protein F5Y04DRAFT_142839 [Hypomontagnella monticulosa]|nr:hypothetical protein F5Y04DRAFT_142839 [Hypomontagnella monticulosa]